ncbi:hypothetical protein [Rhodococcus koreensis]|uniref:hypothetical protein n=1 Tax=Rhodococcus koreensis TaxID=99653 RepID=UPI00197FCEAA|nr:hypothetical protein [Rhodococcus koreensis]QSE78220.1 hypothetical protein JWS14_03155 [Rhodococcus koreensis]
MAVTLVGQRPRGIRGVGAVLDEVPVTLRAPRPWRTWPMQVAGLWGSHETGTRILLAGLLGLAAVLVGDWAWLMSGPADPPAFRWREDWSHDRSQAVDATAAASHTDATISGGFVRRPARTTARGAA